MSDSKSLNDWMQDWEALQRQYMNAWSEVMAKAPTAGLPGANPFAVAPGAGAFGMGPFGSPSPSPFGTASPFGSMPFGAASFAGKPAAGFAQPAGWQEGFEQWSQMFANASQQSDTIERLQDSAKSYLAMIQSIFGAAQHAGMGATPANPIQAWLESFRSGVSPQAGFAMPGLDPSSLNNPFAKALRDMAGHGAKGFTEMPAAFAPFIEQLRLDGMSWLKVPAFGVGREHQEHYQKTAVAFAEYSQALQNYNALMNQASQRGFERFEVKLAERGESMRSIESLRALYDLWVDAAEEAYAEIALSEEFAKVYGELANAQMRARAQVQAQVERVSTDLGMPTRSELNSLHKRVHDLRREVRDDKEARADTRQLEAQVAALRAEVHELKQGSSPVQKKTTGEPKNSKAGKSKKVLGVQRKAAPKAEEKSASATPLLPPTNVEAATIPPAAKRPRSQRRVRVPLARSRAPAPVVRPRPISLDSSKPASGIASFDDAIAAMRQRVSAKSAKHKSVGASMSKPTRQHAPEGDIKKSRKRRK